VYLKKYELILRAIDSAEEIPPTPFRPSLPADRQVTKKQKRKGKPLKNLKKCRTKFILNDKSTGEPSHPPAGRAGRASQTFFPQLAER